MRSNPSDANIHIASLMAMDKSSLPSDGGSSYNELIFASSPYLLQHAENPVKWYRWSEAAFDAASAGNMPVFLSIGYSTCHWCHVMAHESFEDHEVAVLLNRYFICIKVDREERPDIDDFYMTAANILNGSSGWPLNIFMTPSRIPFMAITYLPKHGAGETPGFMELLANIAKAWRIRPDAIELNCRSIMENLKSSTVNPTIYDRSILLKAKQRAWKMIHSSYDPVNGGFGNSPKFPMPVYLIWLIDRGVQQRHNSDETALDDYSPLEIAVTTLRMMSSGGIWDQLGGGFHRYSVDREWIEPHFEKMLYDQAMLARVSTLAFRATSDPFFENMTTDIISFATRELQLESGAFCAALDADSCGKEGEFYVWNRAEISLSLGKDASLFSEYYGVTESGNFAGKNILTSKTPLRDFCQSRTLDYSKTEAMLTHCRKVLLERRAGRTRPLRDAKVLTGWNGLMISALATAGSTFENEDYISAASSAARFILTKLRREDGRLMRSYLETVSEIPAFLEDYAFLATGLMDLYEATLEEIWLTEAELLVDDVLRLFYNGDSGEFLLTGMDAEQMPYTVKSDHDGVTPSALSTAALLLHRVGWSCSRSEMIEMAKKALSNKTAAILRNPPAHLGGLLADDVIATKPLIATFSGNLKTDEARSLNRVLQQSCLKNIFIRTKPSDEPMTLTVCLPDYCLAPVSNSAELEQLLLAQHG